MEVSGLEKLVKSYFKTQDERERLLAMEFVIEALHQNNMIAREVKDTVIHYGDVFSDMLRGMDGIG
jgi:hypothetical protein